MYLITIARLRRAGQPVPLALLAQKLSISPISANEMCRRLAERTLVAYQPYKGVMLTPQGEPIPYDSRPEHPAPAQPLASLPAGARGRVAAVRAEDTKVQAFLHAHGLVPGAVVTVLGAAVDELLIAVGQRSIALAQSIGADVRVAVLDGPAPELFVDTAA